MTFKRCTIFKHLFSILAKPGGKKQFAKKAPVPRAWPLLQTAKLEKTQTEAWARSKSEELPKSKAKDQTRGSASARLTRLWDFCSRFTPREQRRDQPERLRGTSVRMRCGVPPGGRGAASPQGLGFHGSAALNGNCSIWWELGWDRGLPASSYRTGGDALASPGTPRGSQPPATTQPSPAGGTSPPT